MVKSCKGRSIFACYYLLTIFALIMTSCNLGVFQNPTSNDKKASFQLFVFSNNRAISLPPQATQPEYQDWLHDIDANVAQFNIDKSFISSFSLLGDEPHASLSLTLNSEASENLIKILEPDSKITDVLNGEYSLGCLVDLSDPKAFVIEIQGKRVVGGTLRCPTAVGYTHPEMFVTSHQGKVLLKIQNSSKSIFNDIISSLEP